MRAIYFIVSVFLTLLISEGYSATKVGKVIEVSGKTEQLRLDRIDKRLPLHLDDPLFFMDTVLTGNLSTARLHLTPESDSDVKLFVYENSELKIEPDLLKAGKRHFVAKFNKGLMRFVAKGLKKNKEELRLNLPNCVVGVRGTEGEVLVFRGDLVDPEAHSEGKLTALLLITIFNPGALDEGEIEVTANQGTTKETIVSVGPGETAIVEGAPGEATITKEKDRPKFVAEGEIDDIKVKKITYMAADAMAERNNPSDVSNQAYNMSPGVSGLRIVCTCGSQGGLLCGSTPDNQNGCALMEDFNG